jgi:hypothetical protein
MPLAPAVLRPTVAVLVAAALALTWPAVTPAARSSGGSQRDSLGAPGTLVRAAPLPRRLWIPDTTRAAFRLTHVTTNAFGRRALSTGAVFVPKGRAPRGGWPVISWAHGTSGLGDACAPSRVGPALPERDRPYLARWMREGYAIVASDYVGLGTPGLMAYLHGRSTAHSVVDMVKAARSHARRRPPGQRLARRWVVVGQSQGGGAAIYTARHATRFGGRGLDYRGAVGTGVPAYIERILTVFGPGVPPGALGAATTAYLAYIFTSLRYVHPELGIDRILTATGRRYLRLAETACVHDFERRLQGVRVGDFFTGRIDSRPRIEPTLERYMAMPERGFDRPFFMGHGRRDTDVPYGQTSDYVRALRRNGEPVTFRTYDNDHSGTLIESQRDTIPFVRRLFGRRSG